MRIIYLASALTLAFVPSVAFAQAAPAAAYSTSATDVTILLKDPAAKAVVAKYAPQIANSPNVDQMAGMTLKALQEFAPEVVTAQVLKNIDQDLAKLPPPKK